MLFKKYYQHLVKFYFSQLTTCDHAEKTVFLWKKNENTYDQVEKVWWYEILLSLEEPQAVILGGGTSNDLGEGDKQWFGAHGLEIPSVMPRFNGGYVRVLKVKSPAVFEDFAFFPQQTKF